ncbi:hypothetical protein [Paenibacillus medicaginis]|uniref:Uncharacterized protein n=1 Tax=Paenibacillus medicaginis TaxID=1470560 RepID=A0ABV5BUN5_9BACL
MPVTDKGYEYQMPDGVRGQLTRELLIDLHKNVMKTFNVEKEELATNIGFYAFVECSHGWDRAFKEACLKHSKQWLYEYSIHLEWYEYDIFSGSVGDLMVELGVIKQGEDLSEEEFSE